MATTAAIDLLIQLRDEASAALGAIGGNLNHLDQQAQHTQGLWGTLFSNATNIASSIDLVKGLAGGVIGLASSFISGNAEFERYETQFGVLMGSADAAKQRLADLAQFGASTPFELPELVKADKVLVAFGLHSEDTAAKFGVSGEQILTTIGDVAAGTGVSFEELSLTFGKFASGATGEAIARFQELGIATKEEMAGWGLQFSKSGELLTPAREAFSVLESHVREKFGGMMAAQSQTFEGMVSNLQDWWGATKRTIAEPIFDQLKIGLGAALGVLTAPSTMAAIQNTAQMIAQGIGGTIQFISNTVIPSFVTGWGYVQQGLATAQPWFDAIASTANTLAGVFQGFVTTIWPTIDAIGAFAIGIGDLGTVFDFLADLVGPTLGALLTDGIGVLQSYAQVWIDLGATIMQVASALMAGDLAGAWAALTGGFAQVVADYQFYAQSMAGLIMEIATAIMNAVTTYAPLIYQQVLTWGAAFVDWITPYIPIVLTYLQTFAASIWAWIVEQAPILYQQVLTWGQAFVDWISPYASLALTVLSEWVAGLWAWVQQQAPIWLIQLLTWGRALVDWVVPYIPIALAALQEFGASVLAWVSEQVGPLLASFSAWANSVVAWIPGAIVSFLGAWPGMLGSFLDWIAGAVGPILAQLGTWAIAFVQWILPMLPPFLAGLGGLLGALLAFIVETAVVIASKVVVWAASFLGWIAANVLPALPGLLATILTSILSFIGGAVAGITLGVAGWGVALLAWVKDVLPKIPGALAGILKSIVAWITGINPTVLDSALKLGENIINGIISGVKSAGSALFGALKDMAKGALDAAKSALGIASPSKVMAQEIGAPIVDGIVAGLVQRSPKAVQAMLDLASSMFDVVSKGVEAFGKLTQLGTIPQSAILNFSDAIQRTLTEFAERQRVWDKAGMSAASQFTRKAGEVVEMLIKGVELLTGIANLATPSRAALSAFADAMGWVMTEIVRVSTYDLRLSLTAAVEFASGAKAVLETISVGVTALNSLADFVRPAPGVIQQFADVVAWLVSRFVIVGEWMSGQALGAAGAFAAAAGQVFAVVASGVDALLKLGDFVRPVPGLIQTFTDVVAWLVSRFAQAGQWMAGPVLTAAGAFADGAGKVVGVIAAGVDGLLKLGEFVRPAPGAIQIFTDVIAWLVSRFVEVGQWIGQRGVAAAAVFAEGAGKAISIIGAGVDGFIKLADFKGVSRQAIDLFAAGLSETLAALVVVAQRFAVEAVAAAAIFGEGAGKAVGFIGQAVDSFTKLADVGEVPATAIDIFAANVVLVVTRLQSLASTVSADALTAAGVFGANVAATVKSVNDALQGFATLGKSSDIGSSVLGAFVDTLNQLIADTERILVPAAENIGAALVFGIADGIQAQIPYLVATLQNAAYTMVDTVQGALGIASPSKVFEQIGQYAGQGMVGGMAAMQPALAGAGAGLGMAAVGGAGAAVSGRAGGGGGDVIVNIGTGAFTLNGAQGGIGEKELRRLAQLIKEEIANERGTRG